MHIIHLPEGRLLIDDCYNANPQAMAEALKLLAAASFRRRAAVLGDMGELGDLTEQAYRDMGTLARTSVSDAMPAVRAAFTDGTAMLVKASHAMHFENIVKELEQS